MKCKVRGTSSGEHGTPVDFVFTFNGVETVFTITTHSEEATEQALTQAGEHIVNQDGTYWEW